MITLSAIKVLLPAFLAFIFGISITPLLTHYMYKYKMWKKRSRSKENNDAMSVDFQKIHNEVGEISTPRPGGVVIWFSVIFVVLIISAVAWFWPENLSRLNFLSRNQTLLPLAALIFASIIGLIDDILQVSSKTTEKSDGISRRLRILVVLLIGAVGAWWFYTKLEVSSIHIPFSADIYLGLLFVPLFMVIMLGIFTGSVIDGIDGLAAGVMASAFGAYTLIAFEQQQYDIAALCATIIGGTLAFLWFNIPPARYYLGETGMLGLTVTLSIIAFLTEQVVVLPIIAFPLVLTSLSSAIQIHSKKYFGKKVFKIAPLHHHFEALGWPSYKVTMRYWVISVVCGILGTVIALLG